MTDCATHHEACPCVKAREASRFQALSGQFQDVKADLRLTERDRTVLLDAGRDLMAAVGSGDRESLLAARERWRAVDDMVSGVDGLETFTAQEND